MHCPVILAQCGCTFTIFYQYTRIYAPPCVQSCVCSCRTSSPPRACCAHRARIPRVYCLHRVPQVGAPRGTHARPPSHTHAVACTRAPVPTRTLWPLFPHARCRASDLHCTRGGSSVFSRTGRHPIVRGSYLQVPGWRARQRPFPYVCAPLRTPAPLYVRLRPFTYARAPAGHPICIARGGGRLCFPGREDIP